LLQEFPVRLTLRTLLAYLDDTLEPAQARLIGQKVAESEVAQRLIERIKQVTRKRRLTAPPASGPGSLDANSVAEYLDNVLPGEKLGEVEELLLNSDVHLAEAAACHQILTLFLGQPASVPPTATQRMYGLIKGRKNRPFRRAATHVEDDELANAGGGGSGNMVRKVAPVAGVLALLLLLGFALTQILHRGGGKPSEGTQVAQNNAEEVTGPELVAMPAAVDKPAKVENPPDKPPPEAKLTTDKVPIDKMPEDKPNPQRRALGQYLAPAGGPPSVLLQRVSDNDSWQRVKAGAAVDGAVSLLSLPGYRSELQLDCGLRMVVWGNIAEYWAGPPVPPPFESSVVLHAPDAHYDADFTLKRGRVVLINMKQQPQRVKVRFHDELWELTLRDADSAVALELTGWYDAGHKQPGDKPVAQVDMLGLDGVTVVKIRYGKFELGAPSHYRWRSTAATQRGPQPMNALPRWYTEPVPNTAQAKEATVALDELNKLLAHDKKPVSVGLAEARKDSKGAVLILSILCLGAMDDMPELIGAMVDDRPEVRWAALYTLAQWTGRSPDNDSKLFEALQKSGGYSLVEAQTIMDLLHGFSDDDATKAQTYDDLIDYLRHPRLVIREMAWRSLIQLWPEGRKIQYNPAGPPEMRNNAWSEWKDKLKTGKLPPKGK
jgi:hypothetical protein